MGAWVNKTQSWLLNWLGAPLCALCRYPVPPGPGLCTPCLAALPRNQPACRGCALPLPRPEYLYCSRCLWRPSPLHRSYVPFRYEQPLQPLLQRWKFGPAPALSRLLSQLFCQLPASAQPDRPDLLIPVPLHWRRQWQRGFNQCELLARALQTSLPAAQGVPLHCRAVRRIRATPTQRGLDVAGRRDNLAGAFALRDSSLQGLHIALIDDVMTTGATAEALADTLLSGGANRVDLWAIARTP